MLATNLIRGNHLGLIVGCVLIYRINLNLIRIHLQHYHQGLIERSEQKLSSDKKLIINGRIFRIRPVESDTSYFIKGVKFWETKGYTPVIIDHGEIKTRLCCRNWVCRLILLAGVVEEERLDFDGIYKAQIKVIFAYYDFRLVSIVVIHVLNFGARINPKLIFSYNWCKLIGSFAGRRVYHVHPARSVIRERPPIQYIFTPDISDQWIICKWLRCAIFTLILHEFLLASFQLDSPQRPACTGIFCVIIVQVPVLYDGFAVGVVWV